jgi:hypothetical protein
LATASAILAAQHINLLLISQVKADFTHALPILSSSRCLGSELQVKNVPVFPAIYANSSTLGPPRQLYLLRRAATFAWLYLVNDWISFFGPQQSADEETRLYGEGREFDFSLNDWTVRVALSIVTWFVQARAWLTGMHCFSSLIPEQDCTLQINGLPSWKNARCLHTSKFLGVSLSRPYPSNVCHKMHLPTSIFMT